MSRIIVIGNAPIAAEDWAKIKEKDILIRIGQYDKTNGHCDIWAIGTPIDYTYSSCAFVWPLYPPHSYKTLLHHAKKTFKDRFENIDVNIILNLQYKMGLNYPHLFATTGLVTIEYALHYFQTGIGVLGFTFEMDGWGLKHYYKVEFRRRPLKCHDQEKDKAYYNWLLKKGQIYEIK